MTVVLLPKNEKVRNHDFITKKRWYSGTIGDARANRYKNSDSVIGPQDWKVNELKER